jgi:hypothetical protein
MCRTIVVVVTLTESTVRIGCVYDAKWLSVSLQRASETVVLPSGGINGSPAISRVIRTSVKLR